MNYLKDKSYYVDLYDRFTVEECHRVEASLKDDKVWHSKADYKKMSENEQNHVRGAAMRLALYLTAGERYMHKEETIRQWMERDQKRDDRLAGAIEPHAVCKKCNVKMEYIFRELRDSDNQDRVLFFFTCPSCKGHRALFDNGEGYTPKAQLCPNCQAELEVNSARKGNKITSDYECFHCGFKKQNILNLTAKSSEEKPDPNFEKDKARFCISEEDGKRYVQEKYNLKEFNAMLDKEKEREKNKELYDAVAKIKKLSVADLQRLLVPALQKESYGKLELSNPEIRKEVIVGFTVQDEKSGRAEYDSRKQLEKTIEQTLEGTNWRLMSDGTSYRLGILSGRLKGVENEDDLIELVKSRQDKHR